MNHALKKQSRISKKTAAILAVVLIFAIAGTILVAAALRDTAGTVTEELNKAEVTCTVNSDYTVTNTSDIPALIRVRVIVNKTDSGDIIPGDTPAYTAGSDWTKSGDYLYYNGIVAVDGTTSAALSFSTSPDDDVQVLVLAEAIQAAADAEAEWGMSYSNGSWS